MSTNAALIHESWMNALLIGVFFVLAVVFFLDIVIGRRRDDLGHRVSLTKRLRLCFKQLWDFFVSS